MRYRFDSVWALNVRAETFSDPKNAVLTGGRPSAEEPIIPYEVVGGSIGLEVTPRQYTQLRFETKLLHATHDIFLQPVDESPHVYHPNQLWLTAALVVTIP